ncbi:glycoside hydrolase superfamily [Aspergillus lucknowensis]|uniref:alpha-amylase n=1 Tax=Aspergillus lucknowensis TaxID=176173 RepID=A0ABR4M1Z3_9EURO
MDTNTTAMASAYLASSPSALPPATALAATPAQWRSQSVYFLLTDRFARTDADYIQGMGFTAIWITPVTAQLEENIPYGQAYHGAGHMYLMVDVVANHMGYNGATDSVNYGVFNRFNSQEYFHSPFENCWLGDKSVRLYDLNTSKTDVQNFWYEWIRSLVSSYSIDGIRIDTVKHLQKDHLRDFQWRPEYTCPYQEHLDCVLNYPMYGVVCIKLGPNKSYCPLLNALKSASGSLSGLSNMIETVKYTCADSTRLGSFIEDHDNLRLSSYADDISLAKNVAAFLILSDGIPIIYAGQEQHYAGGDDPSNREATWLSGYSMTSQLYELMAASNAIHSSALAMRKGFNGTQVITVVTNAGAGAGPSTLPVTGTGYAARLAAGLALTEINSCTTVTVDSDEFVPVPMTEGGLPRVLYPSAGLEGSGICE